MTKTNMDMNDIAEMEMDGMPVYDDAEALVFIKWFSGCEDNQAEAFLEGKFGYMDEKAITFDPSKADMSLLEASRIDPDDPNRSIEEQMANAPVLSDEEFPKFISGLFGMDNELEDAMTYGDDVYQACVGIMDWSDIANLYELSDEEMIPVYLSAAQAWLELCRQTGENKYVVAASDLINDVIIGIMS